jgi:leucyl aminopeptidase
LLGLLGLLSAGATAASSVPEIDDLWVTLGEEAFATATDVLTAPPELTTLPRIAEAAGVVLTRIPPDSLDRLSEALHREYGRCGGFVRHEGFEDAMAALDRLRAPRAAAGGALPFTIDRPDRVGPLVAAVSEAQVLSTITALSTNFLNRYHLNASGTASANWIRDLWISYAAARPDVTVELVAHTGLTPQPSVVLTIPGSEQPDEVVVIGGHQDSIRSGCSSNPDCVAPGADDDASGIASISEAIRVALANGFVPQRTVRFMAYAAEEVGLVGSRDIAADYSAAGTNVVAALQQDMTGYTESSTDVALITDASWTDPQLSGFLGDLLDTYLADLTWTTSECGYACSDHAAWSEQGYRAAFAFEAPFGLHSPFIHTSSDTVANLTGQDAGHAVKFARLTVAFLVEASLDGGIFADGFETEDTSAWSETILEP